MVTAVHNHSVVTREILYPSLTTQAQRATCACYVVKKTWRREDVIVAALTAFFCAFKETKSEVLAYFGFYKNAQGQLLEDGSSSCKSCKKKVAVRGKHVLGGLS